MERCRWFANGIRNPRGLDSDCRGLPATQSRLRFRLSVSSSFNLQSMNGPISDNTKAILLLAAPLLVAGKQRNGERILSITEYNQLARLLRERNLQPADLLSSSAPRLLADLRLRFDTKRLDELLARAWLYLRRNCWIRCVPFSCAS